MSKQKSYAETAANEIQKVVDKYGFQSNITKNYIQAQIAINLALVVDGMVEIYGSERRKEIDDERNKMRGD